MPTRTAGKSEVPAVMLVIGGGLWHARQFNVEAVREFKTVIDGITRLSQRRDGSEWKSKSPFRSWEGIGDQVFFVPVEEPMFKRLSPSRQLTILPDEINQMNDYLHQLQPSDGLTIPWVNQIMTSKRPLAYEASGLHVVEPIAIRRADVIFNLRCNAKVDNALGSPYDRTCCSKYTSGNWFQWILVALTVIVSVGAGYCRNRKVNAPDIQSNTFKSSQHDCTSIISSIATIGLALAYAFFADRTQLFNKVQKVFKHSEFLTLCGVALAIGILTIRKSDEQHEDKTSLPLDSKPPQSIATSHAQNFACSSPTENLPATTSFLPPSFLSEWKGLCICFILLTTYTNAPINENWVYITSRLFISSYLFLIGYEHTLYLYSTGDYSMKHIAKVLVRYNVVAVALSYQMYTNWMFYFLAPLCSVWFLVIWGTLRFGKELNSSPKFLLGKIAFSASLVVLTHRNDQPVRFIFDALRAVFRIDWDVGDWRGHVEMDPFIVYVGMVVALLNILHQKVVARTKAEGCVSPSFLLCSALSIFSISFMSLFSTKINTSQILLEPLHPHHQALHSRPPLHPKPHPDRFYHDTPDTFLPDPPFLRRARRIRSRCPSLFLTTTYPRFLRIAKRLSAPWKISLHSFRMDRSLFY